MARRVNMHLDDDFAAEIERQKPKSLAMAAFCAYLIEQALENLTGGSKLPAYCVGAGTPQGNLRPLTDATSTPRQPLAVEGSDLQTLVKPDSASQAQLSSMAVDQEIEPKKKKGSKSLSKHTKGTPDFEAFWTAYQASPSKANGQSKAKAWEVYQDVIKHESPDRLLTAVQNAIADIERRTIAGEFASPLPDCFRWLRDEHYAVWLEQHSAASTNWTIL